MPSSLTEFLDLACDRLGGAVLAASDEFFAGKENLIKAGDPVFVAGKYTDRGKWMDGWETRRKRVPGHDWAVVRLGVPGLIHGVAVDTRFFTGNYPEQASLEACTASADAYSDTLAGWIELVPPSALAGDTVNEFEVRNPLRFTHVRLNIFPDGGVARLRIHGEALPDWRHLGPEIDLAAAAYGATVVTSSDQHYGQPLNLIMPGPGRDMSDGWETRRRRGPGHDWVTLRLAAEGVIERVEVDTSHFKGNAPAACSLDVSLTGEDNEEGPWTEVLRKIPLQADAQHIFRNELTSAPARFSRFHIYPDGGVSRLRLIGRMTEAGRAQAILALLNSAPPEDARAEFRRCCGSPAWARVMEAGRPYTALSVLEMAADEAWSRCSRDDRLEALAAHPRIGERAEHPWSREEQARAVAAGAETLAELEELNRRYREKFGYTFVICATGKTAGEILAILRTRLENGPDAEIRAAAEEQRLITRLRLRKLLS
ncbi:MAG TPA: allantoicase [Terriglobia bacterium]|nr:allantoicase [Terriglobia bacterium]